MEINGLRSSRSFGKISLRLCLPRTAGPRYPRWPTGLSGFPIFPPPRRFWTSVAVPVGSPWELARRGYGCTGVDITPSYVRAARESAAAEALDVQWVLQDVRTFVRPSAYDLALNLYISFGYFDDPAEDLLFVQNVLASLRSGVRLSLKPWEKRWRFGILPTVSGLNGRVLRF